MRYQAIVLRCFVRRLGSDAGATAVEYALMLTFIALVIAGSVTLLGLNVAGIFTNADAGLP